MRKINPWSISTTVRNPDRLCGFLSVLSQLEGKRWDVNCQVDFQIRLLQARLYGAGSRQFYAGLSPRDVALLDGHGAVDYEDAARIFADKGYEDPPMRGRNSFKPLQKLGFADAIDGRVCITESGRALLAEEADYGEIFLRAFLKWQIPNALDARGFPAAHGYCIKPFVGVLRLLHAVNELCAERGLKQKGLSAAEFAGFALTLIDYRNIDATAEEIMLLRERTAQLPARERHAFVDEEISRLRSRFSLQHLRDYVDNAVRYFRLTKYIRVQEWGGYVNLEPLRRNELASLFRDDDASPRAFAGREYADYLGAADTPRLPGESKPELLQTVDFLNEHLSAIGGQTTDVDSAQISIARLKTLRDRLRLEQQRIIKQQAKAAMQDPEAARKNIAALSGLTRRKGKGRLSVELERLVAHGLEILNDAIEIHPNYPLGDDGLPSSTAPAGRADIECFYDGFAAICEVTMLTDGKQWMHEAQPVMRHLREFAAARRENEVYCLFIAPALHADTLNMFRVCARGGYEGEYQRIAPLTVAQFCEVLSAAVSRRQSGNRITRRDIRQLIDDLADALKHMRESVNWMEDSNRIIRQWKRPN